MKLLFSEMLRAYDKIPCFAGSEGMRRMLAGRSIPPPVYLKTSLDYLLPKARVFLIADDVVRESGADAYQVPATPRFELDIPFPCCWYESEEVSLNIIQSPTGAEAQVHGVLVNEIERDAYALFFQCLEKPTRIFWIADFVTREAFQALGQLPQKALTGHPGAGGIVAHRAMANLLRIAHRTACTATEKIPAIRERIGEGQARRLVKVSEVIHVRLRRDHGKLPPRFPGGRMDWSYRWEVMGHWRRVSGVGKDRTGARTMQGVTWIVPHVRGPAGKPLVPKIRVVDAGV